MKTVIATLLNDIPWVVGKPFPGTQIADLQDGRGPRLVAGHYAGTVVVRIDVDGGNVDVWGRKEEDPENGFRVTHYAPCVAVVISACEEREWREAVGLHAMNKDVVLQATDCKERIWTVNADVPLDTLGTMTIACMARIQEELGPDEEEDEEEEEDEVEVRETGAVEVFARTKPGATPEFIHILLMPLFVQQVESKMPLEVWEEMLRGEPTDPEDGPVALEPPPGVEAPGAAVVGGAAMDPAHLNGQPPAAAIAAVSAPEVSS